MIRYALDLMSVVMTMIRTVEKKHRDDDYTNSNSNMNLSHHLHHTLTPTHLRNCCCTQSYYTFCKYTTNTHTHTQIYSSKFYFCHHTQCKHTWSGLGFRDGEITIVIIIRNANRLPKYVHNSSLKT